MELGCSGCVCGEVLFRYVYWWLVCVGTGIVTSVPSDSPDDYAALRDLKNKKVVASLPLPAAVKCAVTVVSTVVSHGQ